MTHLYKRVVPVVLALAASCTIHVGEGREALHPVEVARRDGSAEIVVHLGIPNIGTETSPAWDRERIRRGQQKILDKLGSHATVIERPAGEAHLVLDVDVEGIRRLEDILVVNGYHLTEPAYRTPG